VTSRASDERLSSSRCSTVPVHRGEPHKLP
jgi:hypothetical protein